MRIRHLGSITTLAVFFTTTAMAAGKCQLQQLGMLPVDSRGLVYLRLGDLKHAIRDYDTALQAAPNLATSLYGRGLAELREGQKTQGEADLAAGEKVYGGVARLFASMGLAP